MKARAHPDGGTPAERAGGSAGSSTKPLECNKRKLSELLQKIEGSKSDPKAKMPKPKTIVETNGGPKAA